MRQAAIVAMLAAAAPAAGAAAGPQPAPQRAAPCAVPVPPAGELAAWDRRVPFGLAATPSHLPGAIVPIGRAIDAVLHPTPRVRYRLQPGKPVRPVTYGGLLAINVHQPGLYRVALGTPAWVDVVSGAAAIPAVAHGHGPACTSIRKTVDFRLAPGRYTLQIAGSEGPRTALMVVRVP